MKNKLKHALEHPFDYPPLTSAVFPGDRVALVPDRFAVERGEILGALVESLLGSGVEPENITVLIPDEELDPASEAALRSLLPEGAEQIVLHRFTPHTDGSCSLLCVGDDNEPIALARPIVDADVVLPVERHWPVPPFGHFGPLSVLIPRFSDLATQIRFQAADGVKNREKIIETVGGEIANVADLLGAAMLLEILVDEEDGVTGFLFGAREAVRAQLAKSAKSAKKNDKPDKGSRS